MSYPGWLKLPGYAAATQASRAPAWVGILADRARRFHLPDIAALVVVCGLAAPLLYAAVGTFAPIVTLTARPVTLDPSLLPGYAARTLLRMLAAMVASLIFTLAYGILAAKNRRAGMVLIPLLDILQSIPVLGYLSFTVTAFLLIFPHRVLGAEFASIFAIFTSQAWNMTFSFIQSLRTLPHEIDEASRSFHFSPWQKFWRVEFPFASPGLVWNMMMSMSGGWFFVVASEAISVGDKTITLPGIGSYVAIAIKQESPGAIGWAVLAMTLVIVLYDQVLFRPLIVLADNCRMGDVGAQSTPRSWFLRLLTGSRILRDVARPAVFGMRALLRARLLNLAPARQPNASSRRRRAVDGVWYVFIGADAACVVYAIVNYVATEADWADVWTAVRLGSYTMCRVLLMVGLASIVWVPLGVLIGLRPRLSERVQPVAQFLAAFPANLLFPIFVIPIIHYHLNVDIWLTPLMIVGTQWYLLFNVIAGATAYPPDFLEAARTFRFHGWQWWRVAILPGIFPYYVTGAITASGGAWNASIVSEVASWGSHHLQAHGLGAYIAEMTAKGDFPRIVLGIATMSLFVVLFNRLLWRRLYAFGERRCRLD
jgi:NitT/TauT family transport system permease protein